MTDMWYLQLISNLGVRKHSTQSRRMCGFQDSKSRVFLYQEELCRQQESLPLSIKGELTVVLASSPAFTRHWGMALIFQVETRHTHRE